MNIMLESRLKELAEDIGKRESVSVIQIDVKPGSKKGDGFFGDIYMVTVKDGDNKQLDLIFKCALTDKMIVAKYYIKDVYDNELHVYRNVMPTIQQFQKEHKAASKFTAAAKYYGSLLDGDIRILALEDLKMRGFELFDKKKTLDEDHVKLVFDQYGRFHALSFAYKNQNPEKFANLTEGLVFLWKKFSYGPGFKKLFTHISETIASIFINETDEKLKAQLEKYNDSLGLFQSICDKRNRNLVIVHGDCWSNNMMFRYSKSDGSHKIPEEVCLLDWQFSSLASPVFDLSYFLYSSSSKEVFDKLDDCLDVYYNSLCRTLRDLGSNPDVIYPMSSLKSDWKLYSKYGFLLGVLLHRLKLINNEEIRDFHDIEGEDNENEVTFANKEFMEATYDKECFEERIKNLVLHMYENGAL